MKPTDLQIGNWVLIDNTPRQVVQLTKSKVGYHTEPRECRMHYARYKDVEPIQITKEILKGNGFDEMWDGEALIYREELGSIRITKMAISPYCRIELFINHNALVILENKVEGVRCLHTLQKMMRMFGFIKQIEL